MGFDQTTLYGLAQVGKADNIDAKFLQGHVLAPGYFVHEDGSIELTELSWIKNGYAPYARRLKKGANQ